jgi:hypothetical protein
VSESPVRYLAYGSNLSHARLRTYIDGADAASAFGHHEPCEDSSATPAIASHWIHGRLVFAGHSMRWGGGSATVDLSATSERFFAVEYELSRTQFAHLIRHESPANTVGLDWPALLEQGLCTVGEGGHGTVARPRGLQGFLVTTTPPPRRTEPPAAYLATMRLGLLEWMSEPEVDAYLGRIVDRPEHEPRPAIGSPPGREGTMLGR